MHAVPPPGLSSPTHLQVFNTPELLENILIHLSGEDLLRARDVSVYWNAVYHSCRRIRRKALLENTHLLEEIFSYLPPIDLYITQMTCSAWRGVIKNSIPLQQTLFRHPRQRQPSDYFENEHTFDLNPFFEGHSRQRIFKHTGEHVTRLRSWHRRIHLNTLGESPDPRINDQLGWHDMLLFQPPSRRLEVYHRTNGTVSPFSVQNPDGVRIGQLYREIRDKAVEAGMPPDAAEKDWLAEFHDA